MGAACAASDIIAAKATAPKPFAACESMARRERGNEYICEFCMMMATRMI
jgi:hypothetical protein